MKIFSRKIIGLLSITVLAFVLIVLSYLIATSEQRQVSPDETEVEIANHILDPERNMEQSPELHGVLASTTDRHEKSKPTLDQLEHLCPDIFLVPNTDCLLALDDYFLDSSHEPRIEESVFLTSGEQMTYRRAFSNVLPRYELVKQTMANDQCRIEGDEIQWQLKEECNADLVAETVFLWSVCMRDYDAYQTVDPTLLQNSYRNAMQELEKEDYLSIREYVHTKQNLQEKYFKQAWIDMQCKSLSQSVYDSMGIFEFDFEGKVKETRERRFATEEQLRAGNFVTTEEVWDPTHIGMRTEKQYDFDDPEKLQESITKSLQDEQIRKEIAAEEISREIAHLRRIALRLGSDWALARATPGELSQLATQVRELRPWFYTFDRFRRSIWRASDSERIHFAIETISDLKSFDIEFEKRPIWSLVCGYIDPATQEQCVNQLSQVDFDVMSSDTVDQVVAEVLGRLKSGDY